MAGPDDDTVYAFQNAIARTWAATVDRTTHDPGQPGVRLPRSLPRTRRPPAGSHGLAGPGVV